MENKFGFSTKAIHSVCLQDNQSEPSSITDNASATKGFGVYGPGSSGVSGREAGFTAPWLISPAIDDLEKKIAVLEGAEDAVVLSSGIGALFAALVTFCSSGDHIIADKALYGETYSVLTQAMDKFGIETSLLDIENISCLRKLLTRDVKIVYLESPVYPTMKVVDIAKIAGAVHEVRPDVRVVVNNTLATPVLQNPISRGADIVLHSACKYLNGHGDVIAGALAGSAEDIRLIRTVGLNAITGFTLNAFDAYLVSRDLNTLEVRMEKHCASAMAVARYLESRPEVLKVYYPGLKSHETHKIAATQMRDYGGQVSFELKGGKAAVTHLLDGMKLCTIRRNMGDEKTLIEYPASGLDSGLSAEELEMSDISEGLVCISVGLESVNDIIADLEQSLNRLPR